MKLNTNDFASNRQSMIKSDQHRDDGKLRPVFVSAESASNLRWWSNDELDNLARYFSGISAKWALAWRMHGDGESFVHDQEAQAEGRISSVKCKAAHECANQVDSWQLLNNRLKSGNNHAQGVWWALWQPAHANSLSGVQHVFSSMFEPAVSRHGGYAEDKALLAHELAGAAFQDWLETLQIAVAEEGGATNSTINFSDGVQEAFSPLVPASHFLPWSGAVCAEIHWCNVKFMLHLGSECAERLLNKLSHSKNKAVPPKPHAEMAKASLGEALHQHSLRVSAMLASIELTLGDLQTLMPGDVIPLRHSLDEPAYVKSEFGDVICHAYLGKKDGDMAMELVKPATASMSSHEER